MSISGYIDWGGIAFGAELPTGMTWMIGEDGKHYTIASSGTPWGIGCAETNTVVLTINQAQWRTDLASLAMGTSGTYTLSNFVIATGTKYFGILGWKSGGSTDDVVCVYYKMVDTSTATITGGFFYKSALVGKDGISILTLPVMGSSTLINNKIYAVAEVANDHAIGPTQTPVLMELPDPTATTVDTSAGSWGTRTTLMPYSLYPADTGQQYGGFAGIIQDPAGIRVYSYISGGMITANGSPFHGLTTSGMISTVCSAGSNSGIHDVSADFEMPFADDGLNYAGTAGTSRDYNVSPSISPDGTRIIFTRTFSDNNQLARKRDFSFDPATGAVASIGVTDTTYTGTTPSGNPEWVQTYFDGTNYIFAGRDTHRLLLGEYTPAAPPPPGASRRFLCESGPVRIMP